MKLISRLAIAAALVAAVALGLYWQRQRSDARKRQEAWESLQVEEAIPAAWDQSFAWEKADLKLADFADLVGKKSGLAVELDEAAIAATRSWQVKPREIAVHVPAGEYQVRNLLQMVLPPESLRADLRGQEVVITALTASADSGRVHAVVYPLPQPLPEGLDEEKWQYLLIGFAEGHVEAVPGALIVEGNALDHRRVRQAIEAICGLDKPTDRPIEIPPVDEAHGRLLAALAENVKLDPVETPLKDLVRFIVDQQGVPVVLNVQRLNEAGLTLDIPITKRLHDVTLQSALRLLLGDLELTYVLRDGAIVITTPEDAEARLRLVAHPVNDLIGNVPTGEQEELMSVILKVVNPQSWSINGGPGEVHGINGEWLLVHQTSETQHWVGRFLTVLRKGLQSEQPFGVLHFESAPGYEKIRAALERTIEVNWKDIRLQDAVVELQNRLGIPILINAERLEVVGVNLDASLRVPLAKGRAGLYLDVLLDQLELVAVVRSEVLLITIPEDAGSAVDSRLYDMRGLYSDAAGRERLSGLLQSFFPRGVGSIHFFLNTLIASQKDEDHRQLERLLAELKKLSASDAEGDRPFVVPVDASPEQLAAESILARIVDIEIKKQPLNEAIEELAQDHGLGVLFDRRSLEARGYSYPLPAESFRAGAIPLGSAFDRLLFPRHLLFEVGEPGLRIDTLLSAKRETRLYRIDTLVPSRWKSFEDLESELHSYGKQSAGVKYWLDRSTFALFGRDWLAARGSTRMHWWLADWLEELRTGQTPVRERERRELERSGEQWQLEDPFG